MSSDKMREFLLMYRTLDVLYDYDIIEYNNDVVEMKLSLLKCVMDEIEKTINYLDSQKEVK